MAACGCNSEIELVAVIHANRGNACQTHIATISRTAKGTSRTAELITRYDTLHRGTWSGRMTACLTLDISYSLKGPSELLRK